MPRRTKAPAGARQPGRSAVAATAGTVVSTHGQFARVADAKGRVHRVRSRRKLPPLASGDEVEFTPNGSIETLLPRRSELRRTGERGDDKLVAANIDLAVFVWAPEPTTPDLFLDRYLVTLELQGLHAVIVANKGDLMTSLAAQARRERQARYEQVGYTWLNVSAKTGTGLDTLRELAHDKTVVMVGQSGVGKSSIVNALADAPIQAVGELTGDAAHGTHTTSAARLVPLTNGIRLIDSPGIRSLATAHLEPVQLARGFPEMLTLLPQCRFRNCLHRFEPDCAVLAAAAEGAIDRLRLANYHAMLSDSAPQPA